MKGGCIQNCICIGHVLLQSVWASGVQSVEGRLWRAARSGSMGMSCFGNFRDPPRSADKALTSFCASFRRFLLLPRCTACK